MKDEKNTKENITKKDTKKIQLEDTVKEIETVETVETKKEKDTKKETKKKDDIKITKTPSRKSAKKIEVKKEEKKKVEEDLFEPRKEFGFEQEKAQYRLKENTINSVMSDNDVNMFANENEEIDQSELKDYDRGIKRYIKSRMFGKKSKQTLISKLLIELVYFVLITVMLVVAYLLGFKKNIISMGNLKTVVYILFAVGVVLLEIGFRKKKFTYLLRGVEFSIFSVIYTYYINIIAKNTYSMPSIQRGIIVIIYGYFFFKLLLVANIERLKHQKTYIDIRELTKED